MRLFQYIETDGTIICINPALVSKLEIGATTHQSLAGKFFMKFTFLDTKDPVKFIVDSKDVADELLLLYHDCFSGEYRHDML